MYIVSSYFIYMLIFYIFMMNALLGILAFILCFLYFKKVNRYVIIMLAILFLSTFSILYYKPIDVDTISVVVENNLTIEEDYVSFETTYKRDRYVVYLYNVDTLEYGSVVELNDISTHKITNSYNNPSSFDYEKYMLGNEISYTINATSSKVIATENNIRYFFKNRRHENITYNIDNVNNSDYINALVYGENNFEDDKYNTFAELNLLHALTISGSHLVLIIGFIRISFSFLKVPSYRIDKLLLIFLPIYCIFAGSAIPIIRATLLEVGVILFSSHANRKEMTLIIFIGFCILNPFVIFLVSFQLTFLISFLLFYIDYFITAKNTFLRLIQTSFWISYFILPITLNMNYEINYLSPIANLILVPIISFAILPLCFAIELLPLFTNILPVILNYVIIIFEKITTLFSHFTFTTGHIGLLMSGVLLALGFLYVLEKNKVYFNIILILIFTLPINFNIIGSVNYVDVGQGDCIMIELPFNQGNILIDNGSPEAANEIESYLKYYGIRQIDMMFLTHDHQDHIGNTEMITQNFHVKNIYGPQANMANTKVQVVGAGDIITYKGYEFNILYPDDIEENPNSNSLVIQVDLGIHTYLFTGDIEKIDEQFLVAQYDINSSILKVPHHGSNTSSSIEFLKSVSPQVCIISVAENNMYNHPNPLALERIEQNCAVMMTSEDGEIKFRFIAIRSR